MDRVDFGVSYDPKREEPLTRVVDYPGVGQYSYSRGTYTFSTQEREPLFIAGEKDGVIVVDDPWIIATPESEYKNIKEEDHR